MISQETVFFFSELLRRFVTFEKQCAEMVSVARSSKVYNDMEDIYGDGSHELKSK